VNALVSVLILRSVAFDDPHLCGNDGVAQHIPENNASFSASTRFNVTQLSCLVCLGQIPLSRAKYVPGLAPRRAYHSSHFNAGLNYLVTITPEGKLIWAKNNQPVDTTAGDWRNSEGGGGVIAESVPNPKKHQSSWPAVKQTTHDGEDNIMPLNLERDEATHYTFSAKKGDSWLKYLWRQVTLSGLTERLLRKTVKQNTWIYITVRSSICERLGRLTPCACRTRIVR